MAYIVSSSFLYMLLMLTCTKVKSSQDVNITRLLQKYFTLCGPGHLCFSHGFAGSWTMRDVTNIEYSCPPCSCDKKCFLEYNCCPDLYFSVSEPICKSAVILNASVYEPKSTFLVIDSCPQNTDKETGQACTHDLSETEKLLYPPVTSKNTSLTYSNRFCAECNADLDFDPWPTDIVCDLFLDINFFSSYEEVIEKGKEKRCNIFPYPPDKVLVNDCSHEVQVYFDSCNKTGSWEEIDYDIQHGCESRYRNSDNLFTNMFCKICNPGFYAGDMIDRCNVSGMWDVYNATYESGCLNYDINTGTFPYKNIFCLSCNKPVARHNFSFPEVDMKITRNNVKRDALPASFYFDIRIRHFNMEFYGNFSSEMNYEQSNDDGKQAQRPHKSANITNIMHKKIALGGIAETCGKYGIPDSFSTLKRNCSCDQTCIFTDHLIDFERCCADMPLLYPSQCLNEKILSHKTIRNTGEEFLVTNGCFRSGKSPDIIERGCLQQFEDAFSLHPVTELSTGIPYLNMYCLLCNHAPSPTVVQHKPWDITASCSVYIEHSNFFLFSDFLKTLRAAGCDTTYHPQPSQTWCRQNNKSYLKTCPSKSVSVKDKCNITGNWPKNDPDVRWACESIPTGALARWSNTQNGTLTEFKNVYCALCNPPQLSDVLVDKCSYDMDLINVEGCHFFPTIFILPPYRNIFCGNCNGYHQLKEDYLAYQCQSQYKEHYISDINPGAGGVPLRGYFSPFDTKIYHYMYLYPKSMTSLVVTNGRDNGCFQTQILDPITGLCRNVTCYPGKILHLGESCIPLFRESKNLGYNINVYFTGSVQFNSSATDILTYVFEFMSDKIKSNFKVNPLREFTLQIDKRCKKDILPENSDYFHMHLSFTLFFRYPISRLQTELYLVDIKQNLSIPGLFINLNTSSNGFMQLCSSLNLWPSIHSSTDSNDYRVVRVTNLLLCKQIQFNREEFQINNTGRNLFLTQYNISLNDDEFDILPDGTARVCVFTLTELFNNRREAHKIYTEKTSLDTVTFVSLVLSCVFLLITFCTYCIFRELQTLPGGTIMVLVAVLFTTHIFVLISYGEDVNTKRCIVYGIITHYLWLVSFLSMNVCSFHLYRVFHSKIPLNHISKCRALSKYCIYIFSLPVIFVSSNIAMTMLKYSDIGYGKVKCFIDEGLNLIVFFLIPVGLLCVANVIFFTKTLSTIIKSPKIRKNKAKTNDFSIFARLFTITGATWLLQILDGLLQLKSFSVIVNTINSLQGVLIFTAFVCSSRTLRLYKGLIQKRIKKEESVTSETLV
ncbi:uncharacterized protein LOC125665932 [Ostrea edulis]|uniref:uncharacterized protein LOC125665932 n=1 Tax=Ostrea edulis TaxID=37623 RepID=UPI0024AEBBE8|nr:uncharacterized protein LOC125665932 [Ostrea edulis]